MRVAVVTYSLSEKSGARAPVEIAKAFAKQKHDVWLHSTTKLLDKSLKKRLSKKIHVSVTDNPHQLYKNILSQQPDFISFNGILSQLIVCKLINVPTFSFYYGTQFLTNPLLNIFIYFKSLLLVWLPTKVFGVSNYCSDECFKLFKRKVTTIYQGSDHLRKSLSPKKSHQFQMISVSRIVPYKGFHFLMEIIKDLKVKFIIVGSNPDKKYLNYLYKIKPSNTEIIIDASDSVLAKLYASSHIYLNADRYLFFGLPIFEANSFGLPVISFPYAAASEVVIHGKTGYISDNSKYFKKNIIKLIQNSTLRYSLGKKAIAHQKKFTWNQTIKNIETQYEKHKLQS